MYNGNGRCSQLAELADAGAVAHDAFGYSVAISGTTIVVGAPWHTSDAGRAYVFTKTTACWDETELEGSGTVAGDFFGGSVAVSGTTIVVGAATGYGSTGHGRGYVFTKTATGWQQSAVLHGLPGGTFGDSVAISGTTIVVSGIAADSGVGSAFVFSKTPTGWNQTSELVGSDTVAVDGFGSSVAISAPQLLWAPNTTRILARCTTQRARMCSPRRQRLAPGDRAERF